jgi:hypothetical protein
VIASKSVSQSATDPTTPTTDSAKQPELMINNNQLAGIESLRTKCNLPAAEDIEAQGNRVIALNWLYRLSGRTNGIYTGLWQQYQAKLAAAKAAL